MSRKIIGVTVGTTLPKPNFDQTDPSKGDYIRGDRSFLHMDETLATAGRHADAKATGDAINKVQTSIDEIKIAIGNLDNKYYTESEIDSMMDNVNAAIDEKSDANHLHDDMYYTETEIDNKLSVMQSDIDTKVDVENGKGLSTNDYTTDEKNKLASIEANANSYEHPAHTHYELDLYKVEVDGSGHVSKVALVTKEDIVAFGIPEQDTIYDDSGLTKKISDAELEIENINKTLDSALKDYNTYKEENNKAVADNATNIVNNGSAIKAIQEDYLKSSDKKELDDSIDTVSKQVSENKSAIEILNSDENIVGSVKQSIDKAFNEFAANVTNDDVVNTYKELIDYAAKHGPEFTELVGKVDTINTDVGEIETDLSNYKTAVYDQFTEVNMTINDHVADEENPHNVTKDQVGLDQVDNTSDMDKPISNAVDEALQGKADLEHEHNDLYYTKDEILESITVEDIDDICEFTSGEGVDLASVATEEWVRNNYQTKGDYLTEVPDGYATEQYTDLTASNLVTIHNNTINSHTDIRSMINNLSLDIAEKEQLIPNFANSIEECTDTTKCYVLPDGYIYAYMGTEGAAYTNLADPTSADWLTNKRFSTSSISDASGGIITNHIPAKNCDVVRVRGLSLAVILGGSNARIRLYNDGEVVDDGNVTVNGMQNTGYTYVEGDTTVIDLRPEGNNYGELEKTFDSIRLNGILLSGYTVNDIIITINEEIVDGTVSKYSWESTGRKFITVPENDPVLQEIVREEITNLQLTPNFANNIEECTDTTKLYVLPDGYIYAYLLTEVEVEGYKNWIPYSTVSGGGSIYNGTGYKLGYRLNSSAVEKELVDSITFGFIPVTKNSVLRIKNFAKSVPAHNGNYIHLYDSSYALLTKNQEGYTPSLASKGIGTTDDNEIYTVTPSEILDSDSIAFVRVSSIATGVVGETATEEDATKFIITVDEEIVDGSSTVIKEYAWTNTGHAFVPAPYEDKIIVLENTAKSNTERITVLEANAETGDNVPAYWVSHLKEKAKQIQVAMEDAGRNKSAFLWYTDAHWVNGNSKMSPMLLKYLYKNTPMNKVNFGGDIIGDSLLETRDAMSYLYEWRRAIKDLPNHHSVLGNHDNFRNDNVDYDDDNFVYSFLIAPEESTDMVMGGDFYYYIDNPCEKTRYLYLDSGRYSLNDDETAFIIDALKNTPSGWHIVVISHIWFQYSAASTPTTGSMNGYMQKALNLFDAYNSRGSGSITMVSTAQAYDFTNCGGKVEFCIGGHIHVDYDLESAGGIPVIITTADANQNRVPDSEVDSGTIGTITESAVFGIIADYNSNKITVVGVGRGTDRVIELT